MLHRLQHLSDQVARINQRAAPADDEVAEARVDRAAAGPIMRTFPISAVLEAVNFSSHCFMLFQEAGQFVALGRGCDDEYIHWFTDFCSSRGLREQERDSWRRHFFEPPRQAGALRRANHNTPWSASKGLFKKLVSLSLWSMTCS